MERGPFWRAGLLPESPWEAHPVTIIANLGEPIEESRIKLPVCWLIDRGGMRGQTDAQ